MIIVQGGYTALSPHALTDAGVRVIGLKSCRAAKPRAEESVDGDTVTKEPNSAWEQGDREDTRESRREQEHRREEPRHL